MLCLGTSGPLKSLLLCLCVTPFSLSQELSSPDQRAELQPKNKAVLWEIPRFPGGSQLLALFKVRLALGWLLSGGQWLFMSVVKVTSVWGKKGACRQEKTYLHE